MIHRREFIALLGGVVAAEPLTVRAQPTEEMRRVGVLMGMADDAESQSRVAAFREALQELGWIAGENVEFNYRWHLVGDVTGTFASDNLGPREQTTTWNLAGGIRFNVPLPTK